VLIDAGYAVRVYGDGRSAVAAIIEQLPAVVLLDLELPAMPVEEVLTHVRQQLGADLPIVCCCHCYAADNRARRPSR